MTAGSSSHALDTAHDKVIQQYDLLNPDRRYMSKHIAATDDSRSPVFDWCGDRKKDKDRLYTKSQSQSIKSSH